MQQVKSRGIGAVETKYDTPVATVEHQGAYEAFVRKQNQAFEGN
jgi:hypothetical protein